MKKILFLLLTLAFAIAAPASRAQTTPTIAPRTVADHIAARIAEIYFDPARGEEVAGILRQRAASGAFDRYTNPRDLASAIAASLTQYDHHFQVDWSPPESAASAAAPTRPDPTRQDRQLARANYGFQSAQTLPGGVGYIDVRSFANFSPEDAETSPARHAADAAMSMVAGAEAIIIDLRDSAGGSPAMVGYLAAHFVPANADIYNTFHSRGPDGRENPFVEPRGERRLHTPLFILTSGRTASASESFAYTLQAAGRAVIVGAPSAGGANPGSFVDAGDGFRVFVSAATPINPITHRNWEGDGVPVNIATPVEQALIRAQALALEAIIATPRSEDAALEARWALDALNARDARLATRELRQYAGTYGARSIAIEGGHLALHRDRRPAFALIPLSRDLFAVDGPSPLQRARFERDERGRITALTLMLASGQEFRDPRAE